MNRLYKLTSIVFLVLLVAGCAVQPAPVVSATSGAAAPVRFVSASVGAPVASASTDGPTTGLQFSLAVGEEQPAPEEPIARPPAEPLSDAETEALLDRLPPLPAEAEDAQELALPPTTIPPPREGVVVQEPFPPPTSTPPPVAAPGAAPLEVVRYSPVGDVPMAPNLSVTFNQPMVALTGLQDLAETPPPVRLSPQPPGVWRWVGTQTLLFQPNLRFPMATEYKAEIPAGTTSALGNELEEAVSWTFTTPPPTVINFHPTGDALPLDPLMIAVFDQAVDPEAVLKTIKVQAGGVIYSLALATEKEIEADEAVKRIVKNTPEGRWTAFRATEPFPAGEQVEVTFGPGLPSAEGPLTTVKPQTFEFRTHGPLAIVRYQCGWDNNCPPMTPWNIEFSNPLDSAVFDPAQITIAPELPGAVVQVYGNVLQIQGRSQGRTTYQVTVSGTIRDIYGQTLGKDQTVAFQVGSADPTIWAAGAPFVVLDPALPPSYSVFTVNYPRLKVKAYAVEPADWQGFKEYMRRYFQEETPGEPPGRLALSTTIATNGQPDQLTETPIDLAPALTNGKGHLVLIVEPEAGGLGALLQTFRGRPPIIQTWIQATQIGLDAFVDGGEMLAWATALTDGAPLSGVAFELLNSQGQPVDRSATSGADGLATLTLPGGSLAAVLTGRKGDDVAMLPSDMSWWSEGGWTAQKQGDSLRWHVFDDRGMYRPGEEVHVKGWIRRVDNGEGGDVKGMDGVTGPVAYRIMDPQGSEIGSGSADLTALGGFDLAFTLPEGMNLGYATLELNYSGSGYGHNFQVQEFRRPEFEVKTTAGEGPHIVGGSANVEVAANYYAGGPLPDAEVVWQVSSTPGSYSPPGWDEFTFGEWTPWWYGYETGFYPQVENTQTFIGRTDASGVHRLEINFESVNPPGPSSVTAQATVMDVNRQAWTAQSLLLVHPSALYVGLRSERMFVEREDPLRIQAIVTDLDGRPVSDARVVMRAFRLQWTYKNGTWVEEEVAPQTCTILSAEKPVQCTFETPEGGTYQISAQVADDQGRPNRTQMQRWVSGGEMPPSRQVEQQQVQLIPDRKDYRPGDTAEILVQSPFVPAEGVLTLRRSGILSQQQFTMDSPTTILRIPIEDGYIPNLYVQVDLSGAAIRLGDDGQPDPALPKRPAFASGQINLPVPPLSRTLAVTAAPRDEKLAPGGETSLDVTVLDADGKPVEGAEVAVVIVDEAILALTSYQAPDPIATFYAQRGPDASDYRLRANIVLGQTAPQGYDMQGGRGGGPALAAAAPAPAAEEMAMATQAVEKEVAMADSAEAGAQGEPIAMRTDFNPLAVFAPEVMTGPDGKAIVEVKLPDNLTRYRVMATAVAGEKFFGKGESALTARLPLMVRPSAPRFLNFGDRFELPVVLQNQTDDPMTVDVAVRATNVVLTGDDGLRVEVPANDRVEVRFPAATAQAGTARFQVAAAAGEQADAAQFELPVWTPATTEAFATYGVVDEGAVAQPIITPSDVFPQFGGLEVTTTSTALQELTDAFISLVRYPFECSEQIASRMLSVAALRDVLTAFQAEGMPSEAEIEASMAKDIQRLAGMQNDDGGFPIWRRGEESWPYHSIHATHALQEARNKGYVVPEYTLTRATDYLRNIESYIPSWYGPDARRSIIAYALNVRWRMGDPDAAKARSLIAEAGLEALSFEAIGWLLPVLSDDPNSQAQVIEIRRYLNNNVTETAGKAHFVTGYGDDGYLLLHSDMRVDGIVLDSLIVDQPESDMIPKLVRGLLDGRVDGHWANTQEDVFILLALDRYFNTYEAETPDFVARMWLGETYIGESAFQGRSTDYHKVAVPMDILAEQAGPQDLILSKDGEGRLYYRMGLRYAPRDLDLPAADYGFTVERTYAAVDDPADVQRDATGTWIIKAGSRVRVTVTMVAPARRYHVALTDPLPAGLEALNPDLAVTGDAPQNPDVQPVQPWWWWGPWYEHQNLRDERVEAFTSLLWDGVYTYTYTARATTPGQFLVPPARAEEMYAPETFGRSATDRVVVQ